MIMSCLNHVLSIFHILKPEVILCFDRHIQTLIGIIILILLFERRLLDLIDIII